MLKPFFLLYGFALIFHSSYSQDLIDVTDQTIKVSGMKEEKLMFGFASGDKIIFSFEEINNKEVKEIEVIEYPSNSKFSDYKSKRSYKTLTVSRQGVYIFRFANSAIGGKVCKIRIQRV